MNIKLAKEQTGLNLIGWTIAILFIFLCSIILVFFGTEVYKDYWDYRLKQMCEVDGGDIIYEKVFLNNDQYKIIKNTYGSLTPNISRANNTTPYTSELNIKKIREGYIKINRYELLIKKQSNSKILGRRISYSRVGGDFPIGIAHSSKYSCPEYKETIGEKIFIIGNNSK